MLAKYYVTTKGTELSREGPSRPDLGAQVVDNHIEGPLRAGRCPQVAVADTDECGVGVVGELAPLPGGRRLRPGDSLDRRSFMPGVLLAVRRVSTLPDAFTVGLETLL